MSNQENLLKIIKEKLEYAHKRYNESNAVWEINKSETQINLLTSILKEAGLKDELPKI